MKFFSAVSISLVLTTGIYAQNSASVDVEASPTRVEPSEDVVSQADELEVMSLTIDASDKTNFQYFGLENGLLVPVGETETWIFGVRRYIFKTQTGSNGPFEGGTSVAEGSGFSSFNTCAKSTFEPDEVVSMLGYTISANPLMTSEWYDYNDLGSIEPMDKFFAIARDSDCLKLKILSYVGGVYEIEYSQVP